MSLVRLLTSGKSLVGVQDTPNSYRLTSQRLLPQFGPARNPFSRKAKSNVVQAAEPALGDNSDRGASEERREVPSSSGKLTTALQSGVRDRKASAGAGGYGHSGALRLRAAALLKACRAQLRSFFGHGRAGAVKPAIPPFARQPVQGELSLDKVKVVRNDLSDGDLEVVPAKQSATRASPVPASQDEARTGVAESSWGRVADRIFGAGKA